MVPNTKYFATSYKICILKTTNYCWKALKNTWNTGKMAQFQDCCQGCNTFKWFCRPGTSQSKLCVSFPTPKADKLILKSTLKSRGLTIIKTFLQGKKGRQNSHFHIWNLVYSYSVIYSHEKHRDCWKNPLWSVGWHRRRREDEGGRSSLFSEVHMSTP